MSNTTAQDWSQPPPEAVAASADVDLAEALSGDITNYSGGSIVFGIMIAGGAYPIVLSGIYAIIGLAVWLHQLTVGAPPVLDVIKVIGILLGTFVGGFLCAFIGVVLAAIASGLTMPVVYLFARSLKLRGRIVTFAAVCGGLVGFVSLLPITLSLPWTFGFGDVTATAMVLATGPGLATFLGQIGGAWGGGRAEYYARRLEITTADIAAALNPSANNSPPEGEAMPTTCGAEPRLQFRIVHVLWIFVWLSLVLSAIKLSGMPFEFVLPLLVGWLIYQLATLRVAIFFGRLLGSRTRGRRGRST